jgi:hypothetical protein
MHLELTDSSHNIKVAGVYQPNKYSKDEIDNNAICTAVGEGSIWVCEENGIIANGDYLTSSSIPGFGMRQDSTQLHNYTAAKSYIDCSFGEITQTYTVPNSPPKTIKEVHFREEQRPRTETTTEIYTEIQTITLSNQTVSVPVGTVPTLIGFISGENGDIPQ